tara:strand:+ start:1201 stop:1995 length:795 start_codon:yes stop_codon:yes gene_type:complete
MILNKEKIDDYLNNGVTILRNVISEEWLKKIEIGIEKNFKNPSIYKCVYEKTNNRELFYDDYCNWKRILEYKDFFFNSGISKIVAQLMKSKKVNIFHEHVLIKESGSIKKTPWHQDQSYYCVDGADNCSLWIPLDYISKSNCPEFIIKSHKWKDKFLPTKFYGKDYELKDKEFIKIPDIENNKQDYQIISWDVAPGDAIAFNFATVHGAPGNSGKTRRRAFSARFTGDDATFAVRRGEISPPFPEVKLKHGDKMDCDTFPVILI